jgi:hypothetical protein
MRSNSNYKPVVFRYLAATYLQYTLRDEIAVVCLGSGVELAWMDAVIG